VSNNDVNVCSFPDSVSLVATVVKSPAVTVPSSEGLGELVASVWMLSVVKVTPASGGVVVAEMETCSVLV
jgi:hypothetical protein